MVRTFKALGVLLLYPNDALRVALPEIEAVLDAEALLTPARRAAVGGLLLELATADPLDLEEAYVGLFDRGTALSLHLFQHAYGDARERGTAMVALREMYARHGLVAASGELPDFVPVLCEFLSEVPVAVGRPVLADAAPVLRLLHRRLAERGSAYAAVFGALLEVAGETVEVVPCPAPQPLDWEAELAQLDAEWQEEPVTFGAKDPLMLRRAQHKREDPLGGASLRARAGDRQRPPRAPGDTGSQARPSRADVQSPTRRV